MSNPTAEIGKNNETVDHRDSEFQKILDIKPTKIIERNPAKDNLSSDNKEEIAANNSKEDPVRDIFDYFQLPLPKDCDKGILSDVQEISNRLQAESRDNDDFFLLLQSIERSSFTHDDPIDRVKSVLDFLKAVNVGIRDKLKEYGCFNMDILLEEAKKTGNFSRYLKEAEARDAKIRNNS